MDLEKKKKAIEQLKKSKDFPKSELNFQLLDYLAKLDEGVNVKSSVIALELLGDKNKLNGNSQDSYIRNKLHHLRKSLELYYHTEGKNDSLQLQIPNRYYKLLLIEKKQVLPLDVQESPSTSFLKKASTAYLLLAFCLLAMLTYLVYTLILRQPTTKKDNFISTILGFNKEVDIIVGDTQLYSEFDKDFGRDKFVYDRGFYYNDPETLSNDLKNNFPHRKINTKTSFFHVSTETMIIASKIQLNYGIQGTHTEIRRSSSLISIQRPTVFLSKCKSCQFYQFSKLFKSERFVCKTYGNNDWISMITHFKTSPDSSLYFFARKIRRKNKNTINEDYIIIKKTQGSNGKPVLFLLPGDEFAKLFIIDKLDNDNFNNYLINHFKGNIPSEFEMLLKIQGESILTSSYEIIYSNTEPN